MNTGMIFLQQLINGLSLGSIYALIALGYTMVYGIVKLINFAHGDIMMIGAYTAYFVLRAMGTNVSGMAVAFVVAMTVCALLSIVIERFAYRPLRNAPRLNSLITAIAVDSIVERIPTIREILPPHHITANRSLPRVSVPKR